nr:hypothetical protein [Micromonospora sp. DSM 115978]
MPQLPKVAVVGDDALADAVCEALVDGGLAAVRVAVQVTATATATAAAAAGATVSGSRGAFEPGAFDATVTVGGTAADAGEH